MVRPLLPLADLPPAKRRKSQRVSSVQFVDAGAGLTDCDGHRCDTDGSTGSERLYGHRTAQEPPEMQRRFDYDPVLFRIGLAMVTPARTWTPTPSPYGIKWQDIPAELITDRQHSSDCFCLACLYDGSASAAFQ